MPDLSLCHLRLKVEIESEKVRERGVVSEAAVLPGSELMRCQVNRPYYAITFIEIYYQHNTVNRVSVHNALVYNKFGTQGASVTG